MVTGLRSNPFATIVNVLKEIKNGNLTLSWEISEELSVGPLSDKLQPHDRAWRVEEYTSDGKACTA